MIPVTTFAGKKLAVFGLGASGLATCRALLAGGAEVVAFDDDAGKVAQAARAGIPTADLRHIDWSGIAAFVLSPGVPLTHPAPHWSVGLARNAAVEVIGDIELYCRQRRATAPDSPFIAITGTNGKSTTTALVAHVLACAGYDASGAATSAPRSSRLRRRTAAMRTSSSARPIRSIWRRRSIPWSEFCST